MEAVGDFARECEWQGVSIATVGDKGRKVN